MKKLNINIPGKEYTIYIEKGSLSNIGERVGSYYNGKKIAIITDENLYSLYGGEIEENLAESGFKTSTIVVKPGEASKSLETLQYVYDKLLDFAITRSDLILALGGGVVGDLAGFAAATLLRGIPFIQIPTSLLAQVDSSVGGKVAVNLDRGKNLVGSFYQPLAVFIDPEVLKTLNEKYLQDGMAEIIKYACIKSESLFKRLYNYKTEEDFFLDIEEIIYICLNIKKDIVEKDEMDRGERMLLNFGHTIGHGIEKLYNYQYSHGQAVAIGMYNISKNSERLNLTEEGTAELIKSILEKYKLPYKLPAINKDNIEDIISLDKKNDGDYINIVLLYRIASSFTKKIRREDIKDFIGEI